MVKASVAQEARQFYVYVIFRPNGEPCYVGKGQGDRWQAHLRGSHNRYLRRIAAKEGHNLPIIKIRDGATEIEAFETEVALIAAIGRRDIKTGPLVNLTSEGVSGREQTADQIEKLRQTRIGRRLSEASRARVREFQTGRSKPPEHCAAISAAKKGKPGKPPTAETRAKMSAAQLGRWTPEARDAHGALMREVNASLPAEVRARKSERITQALTGKKLSEAHRAKTSAVHAGVKRGPMPLTQRLKLSAATKGRDRSPRSPESKVKRKATWAAKRLAKQSAYSEVQMDLAL
jgi:hypothetical protein